MKRSSWFIFIAVFVVVNAVFFGYLFSGCDKTEETGRYYVGKVVKVHSDQGELVTVETDSGYFDVKKGIELPMGVDAYLSTRKTGQEYSWVLVVDGKELEVK